MMQAPDANGKLYHHIELLIDSFSYLLIRSGLSDTCIYISVINIVKSRQWCRLVITRLNRQITSNEWFSNVELFYFLKKYSDV